MSYRPAPDARPPRLLGCSALVWLAFRTTFGQGVIPVTNPASAPLSFSIRAEADLFLTTSKPGGSASAVDEAGLDQLVQGVSVSAFTALPGTLTTAPSGASIAYWNPSTQALVTQAEGNACTLLLAKLRNDTGGVLDALHVSYAMSLPPSPEWLKGHRLYWSLTGMPGGWVPLGTRRPTQATLPGAINLVLSGLAWPAGADLHLLWADDNGTGLGGEIVLDDIRFAPVTGPVVALRGIDAGSTVGSDVVLESVAATAGATLTHVSYFSGSTPLGSRYFPPYRLEYPPLSPGAHTLSTVAFDSLGRSVTSTPVSITVAATSGPLSRGPYLQMASPNRMTIKWRGGNASRGWVRFGTSPGSLSLAAIEPTVPVHPFDHEVTLAGLSPETTYYYSVGSLSDTLASGPDLVFKTPPPEGSASPTRVWVLGDAGTAAYSGNPALVRDSFLAWTGARTPDLVLQLGDNAYLSGTDVEYQRAMFDLHGTLLRRTPFWSCLGNHETDQAITHAPSYPYFDIYSLPSGGECGGVPSGTEHYYSFNRGNVHFIALDSMTANRSPSGAMAAWLRNDLATASATWIICFFHHPVYTRGSHNSDLEIELIQMRQNLLPILEEGGVDLVLCGHSHSYERSFLLDGHYGPSTSLTPAMKRDAGDGRPGGDGAYRKTLTGPRDHLGAVYVVAGNAGQVSGGTLDHPAHFLSLNHLGSLVLDIEGPRLDVTFLRENGATPDSFSLIKQGAADVDQDLIPDEYEVLHGLDRRNPADALLDFDGDGASNRLEYQFNTAAGTPDRYDFTVASDPQAGTTTVVFPTELGRTYRVMTSPDLLSWSPGSPLFPGTGARVSWVDPGVPASGPASQRRFYRIELVMDP